MKNLFSSSKKKAEEDTAPKGIIEKIGSYKPKKRPGYEAVKREEKIQKNSAMELYSKRLEVSHALSENIDSGLGYKKSAIAALVKNGLSPHSYDGWDEYVRFLSNEEGGYDLLSKKIGKEYDEVKNLAKRRKKIWILSIIVIVVSLILSLTLNNYLTGVAVAIVNGIIVATPLVTIILFAVPQSSEIDRKVAGIIGYKSKPIEKFESDVSLFKKTGSIT